MNHPEEQTLIGLKANVQGRVQGVGFRYYTKQEADRLGITGTVENQSDGSVCITAHGTITGIHALIEWCQSGPPSSEVVSLEYKFGDYDLVDDFVILR